MDGFHLDLQVLQDTARALDQGTDSLRDATWALRGASRVDLGTDALDAAAVSLLNTTTAALDQVLDDVANTATGLRRCLAEYTTAEQRITDLLRGTDST